MTDGIARAMSAGCQSPLAPSDEGAVTEGDWGRDIRFCRTSCVYRLSLRRGVKKTCRWHVFTPDLGGYAAEAATSLVRGRQKTVPMDRDGFHNV